MHGYCVMAQYSCSSSGHHICIPTVFILPVCQPVAQEKEHELLQGHDPKVVHTTSSHTLWASTQLREHTQLQESLGTAFLPQRSQAS